MSVWPQASTTLVASPLPTAKELTSDIVERKNLAYASVKFHPVEGGGHGQYFGSGGGTGLYADPEVAPMVKAFFATHLTAK